METVIIYIKKFENLKEMCYSLTSEGNLIKRENIVTHQCLPNVLVRHFS